MWEMFQKWYKRRFSDPQALGLFAILFFIFIAIYFFSDIIAPLLIALVLAYLLEAPITFLSNTLKLPRIVSVSISLLLFAALIVFTMIFVVPGLWAQTISLAQDLPNTINQLHDWLLTLPEHYPDLIDYPMLDAFFSGLRFQFAHDAFAAVASAFPSSSW